MMKDRMKIGKKQILTGALAGTMILSSFAISAFTSEAETANANVKNSEVVLYEKDAQLSAMAAKAISTKTYADYKTSKYQKVSLNGSSIVFEGSGASVSGSDLLINAAGTYVLSGTLNDGAIIIDTSDTQNVTLIMENVNITCKDGAPIYVKNCGKNVIISLPEGTENTIADGSNYTYDYKELTTDTITGEISLEPSAAIYSKDDLKINGKGKLTINANYNDAITGKDDVEIAEATLIINAADDGIVGKDSVVIGSGNISVKAEGDGIKATNSEDTTKGYIAIADGTFNITSGNDGIQAETVLLTLGGDYTIKTGEGSATAKISEKNMQEMPGGQNGQPISPANKMPAKGATTSAITTEETEATSTKALKAGTKLVIQDGNFNIDSEDDAIHSNDYAAIASGKIEISAGDDGMHADAKLEIYGGDINIVKSYEGLESSEMNIKGGNIDIKASDDGINVAGGNDNSGFGGFGATSQDSFTNSTQSDKKLTINAGKINVNATGDGIDINGSGYMTGGTVAVSGSTNNGNAGLDYDGVFEVTGGTLIVAGSSGMAQAPSSGTTVNTVATAVTTQKAGTEVSLVNSSGTIIMSFTPEKDFSHIVISSAVIEKGKTYKIMAGSTEIASFTADSTVNNLSGNSMNGGMTPRNGAGNGEMTPRNGAGNGGTRPERTNMQNSPIEQ